MKAIVIRNMKFLFVAVLVFGITQCSSYEDKRKKFFDDTFEDIVDGHFRDKLKFEYLSPNRDSVTNKFIIVKFAAADTMPKLKVFIKWPSNDLSLGLEHPDFSAVPEEFKKSFLNVKSHMNYFDDEIEAIKHDDYDIIFTKDSKKLINSEEFDRHDLSNGGLLTMSNVIFNKKRNRALIFVSWYMHKLNSSVIYLIYKLEDGKWVFESSKELWIS